METFERGNSLNEEPKQYQKYPLRRLEPAIQKFLKVIEIDLGRLYRHKLNVERYNQYREWNSLHTEHINATRTVQQIKANITEIEKSRLQVRDEDLPAFDRKIVGVKEKAIHSVEEFIDLTTAASRRKNHESESPNRSQDDDLDPTSVTLGAQGHYGNEQRQLLQDQPQNNEVVESWENLQENLEDLNSMIHQFASLVNDQQEKVDNIENNVEKAHSSVNQGAKQLGKAMGYKAAMFPVAGAVIGTIVAGPIGLVAGAKIGGVLGAVGGGTFGFVSGRFLKNRSNKATEIELSKLSRSNSTPEIHQETQSSSWFGSSRQRNLSLSTTDGQTDT